MNPKFNDSHSFNDFNLRKACLSRLPRQNEQSHTASKQPQNTRNPSISRVSRHAKNHPLFINRWFFLWSWWPDLNRWPHPYQFAFWGDRQLYGVQRSVEFLADFSSFILLRTIPCNRHYGTYCSKITVVYDFCEPWFDQEPGDDMAAFPVALLSSFACSEAILRK